MESCADGSSVSDHLAQLARSKGKDPEEYLASFVTVDPPEELGFLYAVFLELNAARGGNGFGFNPISFAEIAAWCALHGVALQPFDVLVIRRLDDLWLRVQHARSRRTRDRDSQRAGRAGQAAWR